MLTPRPALTTPASLWRAGSRPSTACCQPPTSAALACEWLKLAHLQFCCPCDPHTFCVALSPQHGAHTEPHAGIQLGVAHLCHGPPALHASLQPPAARQARMRRAGHQSWPVLQIVPPSPQPAVQAPAARRGSKELLKQPVARPAVQQYWRSACLSCSKQGSSTYVCSWCKAQSSRAPGTASSAVYAGALRLWAIGPVVNAGKNGQFWCNSSSLAAFAQLVCQACLPAYTGS